MITLKTPPASAGSRILAVGDFRPPRRADNHDLEKLVETDDEWIRQRTGIIRRGWAGDDTSVVDMATAAGAKALKRSGLTPTEIDLVIVATCTHPDRCPAVAPQVADRLGIHAPGATDINSGCAGFSFAVGLADSVVRSGTSRNVLVIGADKLTSVADWTDRSTCILWGDGAGAVVIGPSETPGIGPCAWGSDGSLSDVITILGDDPYCRQQGQKVFRWAGLNLAPMAIEVCAAAGVTPQDIDALIVHQANLRIIENLAKRLGLRDDCIIARDVQESGNTSSASIPLAFAQLLEHGEVRSGQIALLFGFGGGLNWAGQVVIVP